MGAAVTDCAGESERESENEGEFSAGWKQAGVASAASVSWLTGAADSAHVDGADAAAAWPGPAGAHALGWCAPCCLRE